MVLLSLSFGQFKCYLVNPAMRYSTRRTVHIYPDFDFENLGPLGRAPAFNGPPHTHTHQLQAHLTTHPASATKYSSSSSLIAASTTPSRQAHPPSPHTSSSPPSPLHKHRPTTFSAPCGCTVFCPRGGGTVFRTRGLTGPPPPCKHTHQISCVGRVRTAEEL